MDELEFYRRMTALLASWSYETGAETPPTEIAPDANLLENGLLTSLTAVRALITMEQWAGREIDVERYGIWGLWTLQEMYQIFSGDR